MIEFSGCWERADILGRVVREGLSNEVSRETNERSRQLEGIKCSRQKEQPMKRPEVGAGLMYSSKRKEAPGLEAGEGSRRGQGWGQGGSTLWLWPWGRLWT